MSETSSGPSSGAVAEPFDSPKPGDSASDASGSTTFDLLQARLSKVAAQVQTSASQLNDQREHAFERVGFSLVEQDRIRTERPCKTRDAVCISNLLLVGSSNVGSLANQKTVADVFSLYTVKKATEGWDFERVPPGSSDDFLSDEVFVRDFGEIFRYYSDARLLSQERREDELLMVFGIGTSDNDLRVLRWKIVDGRPRYVDANGESDRATEQRFDFEWKVVGRDAAVGGRWPHFNIEQLIFVGAARGHLEFRIDDASDSGHPILREQLTEVEADLSELKIGYARLGDLVLIRLLPYRETEERFYVFNRLTGLVERVDAIGRGCRQLPEQQGIVFPGGFHLVSGETRVFSINLDGYELVSSVRSPNGEDILYIYERTESGNEMLLCYNLVSREMAPPLLCHGFGIFEDGTIVCLREDPEPQTVHTVLVYSSPFCTPELYVPSSEAGSFFSKVGNPELVHALGELFALSKAANKPDFNSAVYEALVARSSRLLDLFGWLNESDALGLGQLLVQMRKAAGSVLDEFSAVAAAKRTAANRVSAIELTVADYVASTELEIRSADAYIDLIARSKSVLGEIASLETAPYVDRTVMAGIGEKVNACYRQLGGRALEFLEQPDALNGVTTRIDQSLSTGKSARVNIEVAKHVLELDEVGNRIGVLTELVSALDVDDLTRKTNVLERLSVLLATLNNARAQLENVSGALRKSEAAGGFAASLAVLTQSSMASLATSSDLERCDDGLAAISAQIENLELSFGDVDEFSEVIEAKRLEISEAFHSRRDALVRDHSHKVDRLHESAKRTLDAVQQRASALSEVADVDSFFATDPLVLRVRQSAKQLVVLGENGRSSELEVLLSAAREASRRVVRDRSELFDQGNVKVGRWSFGVNKQPFELRLLPNLNQDGFEARLTGTELAIAQSRPELASYVDLADQVLVSENTHICRAEFLAYSVFAAAGDASQIGAFVSAHLEHGYEAGIHDVDAAKILGAISKFRSNSLAIVAGATRSIAKALIESIDSEYRRALEIRLSVVAVIGRGRVRDGLIEGFSGRIAQLAKAAGVEVDSGHVVDLLAKSEAICLSAKACQLAEKVVAWATPNGIDLAGIGFADAVRICSDYLQADNHGKAVSIADRGLAAEAACKLVWPQTPSISTGSTQIVVEGLTSRHERVVGGTLSCDFGEAFSAFETYVENGAPRFQKFSAERRSLLDKLRLELKVDELSPKVLPSFVRSQLIDEVYLPLIGDSFARQLGLSGSPQGLTMMISPPGYGKTTLIEYVTSLIGFALVKISGPALGAGVTSLDPSKAPDLSAAGELEKLGRAFAMANNVICYLDDIQHCSAEFLQRFIPLCDGTRRIDAVVGGKGQSFDLAGKRFVMVMAGNPYSSDGQAFRVPDMLANRADVFNLGEVSSTATEAFGASYIENACGVNEVLAPVIGRGRGDLALFLGATKGENLRGSDLSYAYSPAEVSAIVNTLRHLSTVRDQLLKVNSAYIDSATVSDVMRGEPRFLLQGSYRNMARISSKVVPAMSEEELFELIWDHYRMESQTLGSEAGWNMARLSEVIGHPTNEQAMIIKEMRSRWAKSEVGDNPMAVVANALQGIESALVLSSSHLERRGARLANVAIERRQL